MITGWRYKLEPLGHGEGYKLLFAPYIDQQPTENWDCVAQSLDRHYLAEVVGRKEMRERMNKVFEENAK